MSVPLGSRKKFGVDCNCQFASLPKVKDIAVFSCLYQYTGIQPTPEAGMVSEGAEHRYHRVVPTMANLLVLRPIPYHVRDMLSR